MRCRLLIFASVLSLLFCGATIVLWSRSYHDPTVFHGAQGSNWWELASSGGSLYWFRASGVVVQLEAKPLDNYAVADLPRKLPDDWVAYYLSDGGFVQFPGDGRLITSETSLRLIAEQRSWYKPSGFAGITVGRGRVHGRLSFHLVSVSYWLILLICSSPLMILALQLLVRSAALQRKRIRALRRRCLHCGYDLRASNVRCPECGAPIAVATSCMTKVKVQIVRYADPSQPGWGECKLTDAWGHRWTFIEKMPIFTDVIFDERTTYPQPGVIACRVIRRRIDSSNRQIVTINTGWPFDVESTDGHTGFDVLPEQLVSP